MLTVIGVQLFILNFSIFLTSSAYSEVVLHRTKSTLRRYDSIDSSTQSNIDELQVSDEAHKFESSTRTADVIGKPENCSLVYYSPYTYRFTITPPQDSQPDEFRYQIALEGELYGDKFYNATGFIQINRAYSNVTVKTHACVDNLCSDDLKFEFFTNVESPDSVAVRTLTVVNETNILAVWLRPRNACGPIDFYEIYIHENGKDHDKRTHVVLGNTTSLTIGNNSEYTTYNIQLIACNNDLYNKTAHKCSSDEWSYSVQTYGLRPPKAKVTQIQQEAKSASISWTKLKTNYNPYVCLTIGKSNEDAANATEYFVLQDADDLYGYYYVGSLQPYTNYSGTAACCTSNKSDTCGDSTTFHFQTAVSAPTSPTLRLDSKTETTISVKWIAPEIPNGPLDGYYLACDNKTSTDRRIFNIRLNGTTTEFKIPDLVPGTDYWVHLEAFNNDRFDKSLYSEPSSIQTKTQNTRPTKKKKNVLWIVIAVVVAISIVACVIYMFNFRRR